MSCAKTFAQLSSAVRLKVGCVIVKDDSIIAYGYNGTPTGWDNNCEDKFYRDDDLEKGIFYDDSQYPYKEILKESLVNGKSERRYRLVTRSEVLHAETNAIAKVARSTFSSENSIMFVTHAPCIECAKIISQSKIRNVFYENEYRSTDGIKFLIESNIKVSTIKEYSNE